MPPSCTSVIRHDVFSSRANFRNSSADEKVSAVKPETFSNPFIASQIDGSSSIQAMSGVCDTAIFLAIFQGYGARRNRSIARWSGSDGRRKRDYDFGRGRNWESYTLVEKTYDFDRESSSL